MFKNKVLYSVFFFLIAGTACAVSLITLYSQSIRLDESQSIWDATKSVPTLLQFIAQDVHVPLYHMLLHFWLQIFGTDIFFARMLSLIFFLLTLPVLFSFAKESSNEKVAIVTILLFSLSPFVIWYSNEARMYTLFTFVTSLNHFFFIRMEKTGGTKYRFAYIISTILGLYTHYFFNFLLITQGLFILYTRVLLPQKDKLLRKENLAFFRRFLASLFGAYIFFLPWVTFVISSGSASNTKPLIPPPTSYNIFQVFVNFLFGFQTNGIQAALVSLWPVAILMLFFIFTKRRKVPIYKVEYFLLVTLLPIIMVFFASYFRPIFLSRYLIFVTPSLFFVLAWMMMSYSKKVSALLITSFTGIMFGLLLYQNISLKTPVKEDYEDVTTYLREYTTPQDIITVSAPFTIYPIEYSYQGITKIDTIPQWNRFTEGSIPPFTEENLKKQFDRYKRTYSKVYVVLSYDQGYEEKIIDYLDKNYQRVDLKQFSPGLQVRTYVLRYDTYPQIER